MFSAHPTPAARLPRPARPTSTHPRLHLLLLLLPLALSGCLGAAPPGPAGSAFASPERTARGSRSIVLRREQLSGNESVLAALVGRVTGMTVRQAGPCPEITLRGPARLQGVSEPRVYVDGSPAANTCILQQMRTDDVERVEVLPGGVAGRPGYMNHPTGLILVFLRRS